jgi:hypothetical protein
LSSETVSPDLGARASPTAPPCSSLGLKVMRWFRRKPKGTIVVTAPTEGNLHLLDASTDVLDDLKKWSALKIADPMPNRWGDPLTALHLRATAEIMLLRDALRRARIREG